VKALLIGEMPSRSGDRYHAFPLSGAVAQTLCQIAEIPPQNKGSRYGRWTWALYDAFDAVNAIERHSPWDSDVAAAHLREVFESSSEDYEVVVLLGRRPQSAYVRMTYPATSPVARGEDGSSLGFFEWVVDTNSPTGRREVVVIPHPSSLNRLYNVANTRWRAGLTLQDAIRRARQMHETRL
jgi:uracil-DNA glycosylase